MLLQQLIRSTVLYCSSTVLPEKQLHPSSPIICAFIFEQSDTVRMIRITFTAVLALIASAQASFKIPPDTPDGVYGVTVDESGAAHHFNKRDGTNFTTPTAGLTAAFFAQRYSLDKRADGPKCVDSGAVLVPNDVTQAQNALATACDRNSNDFIPAKGDRYSKFGNAVVYVCNYGVKTQHCYSSELNHDLKEVQDKCGSVAGMLHFSF
jgi:hypothetical protein